MHCRQIQKKLTAFQDGELNTSDAEMVTTHLRSCPSCRGVYARMEKIWQSLDMVSEIEPSPAFYRNLYWKIHAPAKQQQRQRFPWFWQLFPVKAFTLVPLLAGLLLGAFLGNAFVTVGPMAVSNQTSYSQALKDFDSFNVFTPLPPGTLGNSYIKMASASEGYAK